MSGDEIDLAGLRAKADAAIPGPWGWHVTDDRKWAEVTSRDCDRPMVAQLWDDETAEFIAAANPAVVLALLDRVNRLTDALAEQTERADHEDRCAVQNHRNAGFWQGEYERATAERDAARAAHHALTDAVRALVNESRRTGRRLSALELADILDEQGAA